MAQDLDSLAATVRLRGERAGALPRRVLERQQQRSAQLRLVLLDAREGLREELTDALAPVEDGGAENAHRTQAVLDHGADDLATTPEVPMGGSPRDAGAARHLGGGGRHALARHGSRLFEQHPLDPRLGPIAARLGRGWRRAPVPALPPRTVPPLGINILSAPQVLFMHSTRAI